MQRVSQTSCSSHLRHIVAFGIALVLIASWCGGSAFASESPTGNRIKITQLTDRLRVEVDGKLFTEYYFKDVPRPFFYPLIGPGGAAMTRNWPMKDTPGEDHDHIHHRSLWFTHGAVGGHDFWSEEKDFGKIVHREFTEIRSGNDVGVIRSRNDWVAKDGSLVCADERLFRLYAPTAADARLFDFEVTLKAQDKPLVLGDTKEGSMAIRLAETMRLKGKTATGHIVNSAGLRDDATWGKRAEWCDYHGLVDGRLVGVAIFDHPANPRHPTWWHVRDYGLFAVNPFGLHEFEKLADKHAGDLTISAGGHLTFRYRFLLHSGDDQEARVAQQYRDYARYVAIDDRK